jgi:hypothetical protein
MRVRFDKPILAASSLSALAVALAAAAPAGAQQVVDSTTDTRTTVAGGETLTVTVTGAIDVPDDEAVQIDGDDAQITNDGTIRSGDGRAIDGRNVDGTEIVNAGLIESLDSDAIDVSGGTGITITNTGSILAQGNDTKAIDGGTNLTVTNSGVIRTSNGDGKGIEGDENLTVINEEGGLIEALGTGAEAVEADGQGLVLTNAGTIRSEFDDGVDAAINATITNTGLISGNNNDGIELDSGIIVNSGTIISLASDPNGTPAVPGGPPELDAGIDFDAGDQLGFGSPANFVDEVDNRFGGVIEGDIGIVASPGNTDDPTINTRSQIIANAGTITGRSGVAVSLGFGLDQFTQMSSGTLNGIVDAGEGNDTLTNGFDIFGGNVAGDIFIFLHNLAGNVEFDLDQFDDATGQFRNFEQFSLFAAPTGPDGNPITEAQSITVTGTFDDAAFIALSSVILEGDVQAAVRALEFLTVTETGSIASGNAAGSADAEGVELSLGADLTNNGSISSVNGAGVLASSGLDIDDTTNVIVNTGTISGTTGFLAAPITLFVFEPGSFVTTPVVVPDGVQIFSNFGTLVGTSGVAADLGLDDDVFQAFTGGTITGLVDGGDGTDLLVFDTLDFGQFDSDQFINFENIGFNGTLEALVLDEDNDRDFILYAGELTVAAAQSGTVTLGDETSLTVTENGEISVDGDPAVVVDGPGATITNDGTIRSFGARAIDGRGADGLVIINNGTIVAAGDNEAPGENGSEEELEFTLTAQSGTVTALNASTVIDVGEGSDAIDVSGSDGVTITNNGSILANANDTKAIDGGTNLTVINSGIIRASNGDGKGIEGDENLTVINEAGGLIEALGEGAEAVEADAAGLTLVNRGTIRSEFDDAIDGDDDVDITNFGLIEGNNNDGIELNSGRIENSGTIISLASDPDGTPAFEGGPPELDAAIDFDAGSDGNEDGTVINRAGGLIEGDIGIVGSPGNADAPETNDGVQTIVNFGTITGRMGDAVLLGNGDDVFQQWQTGVTNGLVDGEGGDDTLVFGNDAATLLVRSLDDISDEDQYADFETVGFLDAGGGIALTGSSDQAYVLLGGDLILRGSLGGTLDVTLDLAEEGSLTIDAVGVIDVEFDDAIEVNADDFAITNNGTIRSVGGRAIDGRGFDGTTITNNGLIESLGDGEGGADDAIDVSGGSDITIVNTGEIFARENDTKAIDGGSNMTVTNSGVIRASNGDGKGIEGDANLTVTNQAGGLIEALGEGAEAVEADGPGLVLVNNGTIRSEFDDAVDGGNDVTITNTGLIQGNRNDGLELNNGSITNSGTIESLGSDPDGTPAFEGGPPELDAGIDFDTGTPGNENGTVINLAGGIIRGDIGIETSPGNVDNPTPNRGNHSVINAGTIIGRLGDAALLGEGTDRFEQRMGGVVTGRVDLGAGNDEFVLAGLASSISGGVFGGMGTDSAALTGTYDANILNGFESVTLGNLRVIGARSHAGNTEVTGSVTFDLGVDSIAITGDLFLAQGSRIIINTPRDQALVGQTVAVLTDTGAFTNAGSTIVINDNDLLIDYRTILGSVLVEVTAANPVANSIDPNIAAFGAGVQGGVAAGTLSDVNFDALNSLGSPAALEQAYAEALPSLSGAMAREIFETSNLAAQALDRHLAGEGSRVWGQIVLRGADQDSRSLSAAGYDSKQRVFTTGADLAVGTGLRIGVLASYADIETDDLRGNLPSESASAESFKLGGYAGVTVMDRGFVNAELSYLTGEIESTRGGLLGTIASTYDFDGVSARITVGYDLLPDEGVRFVPTVGLNYASIGFDDAVESGGFGLTVAREDVDFLELRGGVELGAQISEGVGGFIAGTVIRDLEDEPEIVRLTSAQLPAVALQGPPRAENRFELAAGASVDLSRTIAFELGYLGDFADGYDSHSARLNLRIAF